MQCLLGRAKRSPSLLSGAKTGSLVCRGCAIVFGTSRLRNTLPYMERSLHCAIVWGLSRVCAIVYHLWYVSKVSYACLLQSSL